MLHRIWDSRELVHREEKIAEFLKFSLVRKARNRKVNICPRSVTVAAKTFKGTAFQKPMNIGYDNKRSEGRIGFPNYAAFGLQLHSLE